MVYLTVIVSVITKILCLFVSKYMNTIFVYAYKVTCSYMFAKLANKGFKTQDAIMNQSTKQPNVSWDMAHIPISFTNRLSVPDVQCVTTTTRTPTF